MTARTDLAGVALFAAGAAVFVVGRKVFADTVAVVGSIARTEALPVDADFSAGALAPTNPTMVGIGLEIGTPATTRGLPCGAVVTALTARAELSRGTRFATTAAMEVIGSKVFADAVAIVGEVAVGIASTGRVDADFAARTSDATSAAMFGIGFEVDATATARILPCGTVVKAFSARADLASGAFVSAGAAVFVIGGKVFADAIAVVGDIACALALAFVLVVDADLSARTFAATSAAVVGVDLEVGTSARARVLSGRAVIEAISARAEFSGVALFAASSAVFVVRLKIFANATAIVGEGAFGFALANTADALVTAFALRSAGSAMEEVGFQVNAAARTRGLSCGAVVKAYSACAELTGIALFAASTAVLVVREDVFADARAVVGQKSRTLAFSADTRLPVLADFAARTAVCGIGLQVDTFLFSIRERATGGRTTLAVTGAATLFARGWSLAFAFCPKQATIQAITGSGRALGEGQSIGLVEPHARVFVGSVDLARFVSKTSNG